MAATSAGLLMYRRRAGTWEVLLVHPGGPFWARKDLGAWSIPKGEFSSGQDALDAAKREFEEELGVVPQGEFVPLAPVRQAGGKIVTAWAFRGDCDASGIRSNTFTMEWPPRSGRPQSFPEVDRAAWFTLDEARERINKGQRPLLDDLESLLRRDEERA